MGRGKLVFKGEDAPKKKKSKKSKHSSVPPPNQKPSAVTSHSTLPPLVVPRSSAPTSESSQQIAKPQAPKMEQGSGRITSSGTVVTGHDTRFEKELSQGDAVIVHHNQQQEMRVVTMRLSNTSCAFSSALSTNLKTPTPYYILRKPRDRAKEQQQKVQQSIQDKKDEEQLAFGTYGTSKELVYREKTEHGSYRVRRAHVDDKATRADLLDMRTKKKSDKYC